MRATVAIKIDRNRHAAAAAAWGTFVRSPARCPVPVVKYIKSRRTNLVEHTSTRGCRLAPAVCPRRQWLTTYWFFSFMMFASIECVYFILTTTDVDLTQTFIVYCRSVWRFFCKRRHLLLTRAFVSCHARSSGKAFPLKSLASSDS